jgi:hypothetical protein
MAMNESDSIDIFMPNWHSDSSLSAINDIDDKQNTDLILISPPDPWDIFITTHGRISHKNQVTNITCGRVCNH